MKQKSRRDPCVGNSDPGQSIRQRAAKQVLIQQQIEKMTIMTMTTMTPIAIYRPPAREGVGTTRQEVVRAYDAKCVGRSSE